MSFNLRKKLSTPVVESLSLEVDGKLVATAEPYEYSTVGTWRVAVHSAAVVLGTPNEEEAHDFLAWLGETLSPLVEIAGPDDLDRAPLESLWQSQYNGNRYRKAANGDWFYDWPDSRGTWRRCGGAGAGPYSGAYPLTAVRA